MKDSELDDFLSAALRVYGETSIFPALGTRDVTACFFNDSHVFADSCTSIYKSKTEYTISGSPEPWHVGFLNELFFDKNLFISDISECVISGMKFLKIITPFLWGKSFDFILMPQENAIAIIEALLGKKEKTKLADFPVIGIDFENLRKQTIDVLLNEDFRAYCIENHIRLKKGIVLQGPPGCGKTLSLKWLKQECMKHNIYFHAFSSINDFEDNRGSYFNEGKKIFVFEEFDAAINDRKNTGETPNQILSKVLTTLDGIHDVTDVITIFTTNHIHKFDDALMRPGRIDLMLTYEIPNRENIEKFVRTYLAKEDNAVIERFLTILFDKGSATELSYALLKGIVDDYFTYKYYNQETGVDLEKIIEEKLSARKKGDTSTASDYKL